MRTEFFQTLVHLAERDPRIWLMVGDLGYSVVEPFAERFPDRYVNVGVAEQNMIGVAAGVALSGNVVFTYSIGNFATARCLEQIRNDVCYHSANVKIVAVGAGLAYGSQGPSHHASEDLAWMRSLPNMAVFSPGDPYEVEWVARAAVDWDGPAYVRIGKASSPKVYTSPPYFGMPRALQIRHGRDITIIATGAMLHEASVAATRLEREGVSVRLLSVPVLKPFDTCTVLQAATETEGLVTVEEHSRIGGLGSAVGEALIDAGLDRFHLRCLALPPQFSDISGSREFLLHRCGLDADGIEGACRELLNRGPVWRAASNQTMA
jgi:transketolase